MWTTILGWLKEYGAWALEIVKEYGKKSVIIVLLITASILTTVYILDKKFNQAIPEVVEQTLDTRDNEHALNLIASQETYTTVKRKLRNIIKETDCEYIYLIEYHNGNENVATSFPFYKFDVTMDVYHEGVPYIDISTLKDEHIYKYDIFDNPEFTQRQFAYCTIDEFQNIDRKLYELAQQNPKIKFIYTYNLYYNTQLLGACMILSYEEMDIRKLINNMHEVECIFNQIDIYEE